MVAPLSWSSGAKYRLLFSVRNYADNAAGILRTGEIEFEVKEQEAGKDLEKGVEVAPKKGIIIDKNANLTVRSDVPYADLSKIIQQLKESGIENIRIDAAKQQLVCQ